MKVIFTIFHIYIYILYFLILLQKLVLDSKEELLKKLDYDWSYMKKISSNFQPQTTPIYTRIRYSSELFRRFPTRLYL